LVARQDGSYWNKDAWKKIFKAAAIQIRKPELVIYSLRHTAISRLIGGGVDSFLIARLAGTSVAMIEKHYGHLRHDETRQKLDAVLRRA
jgi:integrase